MRHYRAFRCVRWLRHGGEQLGRVVMRVVLVIGKGENWWYNEGEGEENKELNIVLCGDSRVEQG